MGVWRHRLLTEDRQTAASVTGSVVRSTHVMLVGGGSRSAAVQQIAPEIFGKPVVIPAPGEYGAVGAARQAAWVLAGGAEPPEWSSGEARTLAAAPAPHVRERYAQVRDLFATRVPPPGAPAIKGG